MLLSPGGPRLLMKTGRRTTCTHNDYVLVDKPIKSQKQSGRKTLRCTTQHLLHEDGRDDTAAHEVPSSRDTTRTR